MRSLPFSVASPTHTRQIRISLTAPSPAFKIYGNHEKKLNNKCTNQKLQVTRNSLVRRREVIGLGLTFTTLVGHNPAEATAPCEFTTTPSGLAFCDKLVGFGPQASKGQLIKVSLFKLC